MTSRRIHACGLLVASLLVTASVAQAQFNDVFERIHPNVDLERIVAVRAIPAPSQALLVVEQAGRVIVVGATGDSSEDVALDISERVLDYNAHAEAGLLSVELHPNFPDSPFLFAFYTTSVTGSITSRISRFMINESEVLSVDEASEEVLIELPRVDLAHNGGDLHFGPDGYLYASIGDGACCADPFGNGQDKTNLFSTIIRIDVDAASGGLPYGIPDSNPFVGNENGFREEIFAYGLRNPWRFSIDHPTGDMYVGDVGELAWEEINYLEAGGNYGWNIMEGEECFAWPPGTPAPECDSTGLILPILAFDRDEAHSITGGVVYRGDNRPDLFGQYVFADWMLGRIWSASIVEGSVESLSVISEGPWPHISAFGLDQDGELLLLDYFGGWIYQLRPGLGTDPPSQPVGPVAVRLAGPNPFSGRTAVQLDPLGHVAAVDLVLTDLLGRRVSTVLDDAVIGTSRRVEIDLSGHPAGTYFVSLLYRGSIIGRVPVTHVR